MKKTPAALKWLAEKRARIAGELESCNQLLDILEGNADEIRLQLKESEQLQLPVRAKMARIAHELASIDQTVLLYDAALRPDLIEPIFARQGNYGKHGALKRFLVETLKSRAPEFVDTSTLAALTIEKFSLTFEHPTIRAQWFRGSFRNTIKVLATRGYVERRHSALSRGGELGSWRWKQDVAPTLAELSQQQGR